jgi:hypothetical protein
VLVISLVLSKGSCVEPVLLRQGSRRDKGPKGRQLNFVRSLDGCIGGDVWGDHVLVVNACLFGLGSDRTKVQTSGIGLVERARIEVANQRVGFVHWVDLLVQNQRVLKIVLLGLSESCHHLLLSQDQMLANLKRVLIITQFLKLVAKSDLLKV